MTHNSEISIFDSGGETFYTADTGWTSTDTSLVQAEAGAEYSTSNNRAKAYAYTDPTVYAISASGDARVSELIVPSGSLGQQYKRYAEFTISGEFRARIAAYGSASASYEVEIFLVNVSKNEEIDRYTIKSKNASYAHFSDVDSESFTESVSGEIQQYNEYRVGVRVNTHAENNTLPSVPTPFASGAILSDNAGAYGGDEDAFNGYVEWDSIELEWQGDAEPV